MDLKNIHQSKTVRGIIIGLGLAIVLLGVFRLGQVSGGQKVRFSDRLGENFNRNFRDPRDNFFRNWSGGPGMPGGHGAVGEIVSLNLPLVTIAGLDNLEKVVVIEDRTLIRQFQNQITPTDLQIGEHVVVLGAPNAEGQIEARLIRVMPPWPENPDNENEQ